MEVSHSVSKCMENGTSSIFPFPYVFVLHKSYNSIFKYHSTLRDPMFEVLELYFKKNILTALFLILKLRKSKREIVE